MNCIPCIVFPTSQAQWMAHLENGPAGPFMCQDLALRVAIIEATRLRKLGRSARLVVSTKDGCISAERCLCERFCSACAVPAADPVTASAR